MVQSLLAVLAHELWLHARTQCTRTMYMYMWSTCCILHVHVEVAEIPVVKPILGQRTRFKVVGRDVGWRSRNQDCPADIGTVGTYEKGDHVT